MDAPIERRPTARKPSFRRSPSVGGRTGVVRRPVSPRNDEINSVGSRWRRQIRAKVGGWTKTRPVSLGLLPSGPDPVGERYVLRQPPAPHLDHRRAGRKGAERGEPMDGKEGGRADFQRAAARL